MPEDFEEVMWDQVKTFTLLPYRDKVRKAWNCSVFIFLTIWNYWSLVEFNLYQQNTHIKPDL